jgi:membrane protease subunit HflK
MRWAALVLVAAAALYAATGIYAVGSDERAVVRRFGRVVAEHSESGLHWGLPRGLDRVERIKPTETKTVTVGMAGSADRALGVTPRDTLAQFLSGDQNLVNVQATVQYVIRRPTSYLFSTADPTRIIERAAEAAITATLADQSIDTVLTTGKSALAVVIKDKLQHFLDDYGLGIEVRSLSLAELSPPGQVADAFTKAASARSDRERLVLEAYNYANEKLAQARGEAQQSIDGATADRDRAIDLARSDADRFAALLSERNKAPALTATRLYLETMAEILPRFRSKLIVDPGKGVDVTILRDEP